MKKKKKIQLFKPEATFLEVKIGKVTSFFSPLTKDNLILKSLNCLKTDLFCLCLLLLLLLLMKGRHNEQPSFHLSFCGK